MLIAVLSIPLLYEDFESSTFPPAGWDSTYTNTYVSWMRRTSGVIFGSASAGIRTGSTYPDTGTASLITPSISFLSLDSLIFYYKFPGTQPPFATSLDTIYVDYSLDGGATWTNLWLLDSASATVNTPIRVSLSLSTISGSNIIFRWKFVDHDTVTLSQNRYFLIDSVLVLGTPAGNVPPVVSVIGPSPLFPDTNTTVNVLFTASDPDGSVVSAHVNYSFDGVTFNTAAASLVSGDTFQATIPARGSYGKVYFTAVAQDNSGDTSASDPQYYIAGFLRVHQVRALTLGDTAQTRVQVVGKIGSAVYAEDSTMPVSGVSSGIVLYSSSLSGSVDTGYVLYVRGELTEYRSLLEISPHAYQIIDSGAVYPPAYITTADMGESYEGMLVAIRGFMWSSYPGTFTGNTNYNIQDASGTGVLRVSSSTDVPGNAAPDGVLEVWGVLSQYNTTYQIYPRYINDFSPYVENISINPNPPVSGSAAILTARVYDFDGLGTLTLYYSTDTTAGYTTVAADSVTIDSTAYFTIPSVPSGDTLYTKVEARDSRDRVTFSFLSKYPINIGTASQENPTSKSYLSIVATSDGLLIRWNTYERKLLKVYDSSGRLYTALEIYRNGTKKITLPPGVYFVRNGKEIGRFIVR